MRTIAVGDIHGCSKALQGLVDAISPTSEDRLIFLGDYVDRGPDSRGVIDLLIELQQVCQTVCLLGNHEIMLLGVLRGLDPTLWLQLGGHQTITSYGGLLKNISSEHREFLNQCVPYYETEFDIFVHANYLADLPLQAQPEETLFWEHLSDRLPQPHISGKHVYCGHTPQPGGKIGFYKYFTCLDTCCFGDFWLSAIDVRTKEVWQVSREGHMRQHWRLMRKLWTKFQRFQNRNGS
jgi:serine/threonine protein phosphatase 1